MELAYFDTETPYIKFQSFPARSFAPKAREHALPRHPPSSLLPPPPLRAMEILGHRSIRGIPRGPWRNGRAGEVLYVSRAGFKNSRAGHRVAGTTTLSTLKRDTFVGNLLSVRKRRRRRRTRYARVSPLSRHFFFSLSSPSSLLPFFQFRRNRQGSVYYTDEFNRSLSRSVGVEDAGNQADATVVR